VLSAHLPSIPDPSTDGHDAEREHHQKGISQPKLVSNWSSRPLTAAEPEFREDQPAGQSPVARGVKCHVTWRVGNAVGHRLFQQEKSLLFRLRAEACDSRWLGFVFVSGTVVAPTKRENSSASRSMPAQEQL
jgi:hypothetical protein